MKRQPSAVFAQWIDNFKQMRIFKYLVLCFFTLMLTNSVQAQIVNIEDKRIQLDSNKWQGSIDLSSKLTQNTKSVLAIYTSVRVDRMVEQNKWLFLGSYNFARAGSQDFLDDGFFHLRYNRDLNRKWQWETFGQVQYNEKLRIRLRTLLGTGARLQLLADEKKKIAVGLLYMYEYNELTTDLGLRRDHRLSSYLSLKLKPSKQLSFASTTYYQPLVDRLGESRFSSINTLTLKVNKWLAFSSVFAYTYDGQLAKDTPDVPSSTYQWKNGVRLMF